VEAAPPKGEKVRGANGLTLDEVIEQAGLKGKAAYDAQAGLKSWAADSDSKYHLEVVPRIIEKGDAKPKPGEPRFFVAVMDEHNNFQMGVVVNEKGKQVPALTSIMLEYSTTWNTRAWNTRESHGKTSLGASKMSPRLDMVWDGHEKLSNPP
jgi:hypothetical protein